MEAKRHLLGIGVLAAAGMLASCQQDVLTELVDEPASLSQAIGFVTNSSNLVATRAENSNADAKTDLEKHHESFAVWGFKNVVDKNATGEDVLTSSLVFGDEIPGGKDDESKALVSGEYVQYNVNASDVFTETKWEYSPVRFWDKMAQDYYFYAAAPKDFSWKLYQNLKQIAAEPENPGTEVSKPAFPDVPERPWVTSKPNPLVDTEPAFVEKPGPEPVEPTPVITEPTKPAGNRVTADEALAEPAKYPDYLEWKAYDEAYAVYSDYKTRKDQYDTDITAYNAATNAYNQYIDELESYNQYLKYKEYKTFNTVTWPKYQKDLQAYNEWRKKKLAYDAYQQNGERERHAKSYIVLKDFALAGNNASTPETQNYTNTFKGNEEATDLMIAEPKRVVNSQVMLNQPVDLDFIHILSRLNISVYKDEFTLGNADVLMNVIEVCNLKTKGSFNENATLERIIGKYNGGGTEAKETIPLSAGTSERWTTDENESDKYTSISEYTVPSTATLGKAPVTADYQYVLQSLVIPQNTKWDNVNLDGTLAGETGKSVANADYKDAYLHIVYEITTKEMEYYYKDLSTIMTEGSLTADQAAKYYMEFKIAEEPDFKANEVSRDVNGNLEVVNSTMLVFKKVKAGGKEVKESFSSYFNLASIFAARPDNDLKGTEYDDFNDTEVAVFCEGWQNNIHFTIKPDVILFDADVYEWADKETVNPILN